MFNIFRSKKTPGHEKTFKIIDMHCTSCALSIDDALEDLEGVKKSSTNYAQSTTKVIFDPEKVSDNNIKQAIHEVGYTVAE